MALGLFILSYKRSPPPVAKEFPSTHRVSQLPITVAKCLRGTTCEGLCFAHSFKGLSPLLHDTRSLTYQRGSMSQRQCGEQTTSLMSTRKQKTQEGTSTPTLRASPGTNFLSLAPTSADYNTPNSTTTGNQAFNTWVFKRHSGFRLWYS